MCEEISGGSGSGRKGGGVVCGGNGTQIQQFKTSGNPHNGMQPHHMYIYIYM